MSTHERSDNMYEAWREASEKFDYFMAGACMATAAYFAQHIRPTPAWPPSPSLSVEYFGLLALVASAGFSLMRLEYWIVSLRLQHQRLHSSEKRGALMEVARTGPAVNVATGDVIDPSSAVHMARNHEQLVAEADSLIKRSQAKTQRFYNLRNWLFILGLLAEAVSRIVPLLPLR